jgi:hypothetical protein
VLLGWLLLLGLFALAGLLHGAWTQGVREERERLYAEREAPDGRFETAGRARLFIGRPSGSPPLEVEPAPVEPPASPPHLSAGVSPRATVPQGEEAPPDWRPPVYEMTVQGGQVLSVICQEFYGTSRPPLPDLVAAYNGLPDADSVRAGQRLLLPPREELRASDP